MVVLGIDPGTASTGYGVVGRRSGGLAALDGGVIATAPGLELSVRLAAIHARVCELLDEHRPDAMAVEDLYFGANVRSAFAVGQARGVVLLAAGARGVPCRGYTPQQIKSAVCGSGRASKVKQAVCGSGRADKAQVQRMVGALLELHRPPEPDHAADALAVAICHSNRAPLSAAVHAAGAGPLERAIAAAGGAT